MRPATVLPLLLLVIVVTKAQGFPLEEQYSSDSHKKIHCQEEGISLMRVGDGVGGVVLCRGYKHRSGRSRKLMNKTMVASNVGVLFLYFFATVSPSFHNPYDLIGYSYPQSKRGEEAGAGVAHRDQSKDQNQKDFYVKESDSGYDHSPPRTYSGIIDIAGMDYSPADRKPPIHN